MVVVLDEAANVCRIADLPELYSHLGSRGVLPLTILQSYRQGTRVWGDHGMDALWSASTCKVLGAGLDDARFAEDVSRLIGDHDVTVRSVSRGSGHASESTSLRRQRILPPEAIRALPRGRALLLATGAKAAMIDLQPWYRIVVVTPDEEGAVAESSPTSARRCSAVPGGRRPDAGATISESDRDRTGRHFHVRSRTGSRDTSCQSSGDRWAASSAGAQSGSSTPRRVSDWTALWRSWEALRVDEPAGMATWLTSLLDPQLPILMGPRGPFHGCTLERHDTTSVFGPGPLSRVSLP